MLSRLLASRDVLTRENGVGERETTANYAGFYGQESWAIPGAGLEMPWERGTQEEVLLWSEDQAGERKKKQVAGPGVSASLWGWVS